jgi:hypothetical protein
MSTRSADATIPITVVGVQSTDAIPQEVYETAERLGVLKYLPQVIDLTREVYGGFSHVSISVDPDFGDTHIVFHVPVNCSIEEALALDVEWGRRFMRIIPRCPRVYLSRLEFQP